MKSLRRMALAVLSENEVLGLAVDPCIEIGPFREEVWKHLSEVARRDRVSQLATYRRSHAMRYTQVMKHMKMEWWHKIHLPRIRLYSETVDTCRLINRQLKHQHAFFMATSPEAMLDEIENIDFRVRQLRFFLYSQNYIIGQLAEAKAKGNSEYITEMERHGLPDFGEAFPHVHYWQVRRVQMAIGTFLDMLRFEVAVLLPPDSGSGSDDSGNNNNNNNNSGAYYWRAQIQRATYAGLHSDIKFERLAGSRENDPDHGHWTDTMALFNRLLHYISLSDFHDLKIR